MKHMQDTEEGAYQIAGRTSRQEASDAELVEASDMASKLIAPVFEALLQRYPLLSNYQLKAVLDLGIRLTFDARAKGTPVSKLEDI